ncbi:hypothetical protein Ciccas_001530 [Cichlidogyrus casuarinus]|uniref:Uncharacterized protein n=1 Tax=Cichlidogyrus casuarinus TaxID=1844966 RepID=A0ABD2QJT4_9PLAT
MPDFPTKKIKINQNDDVFITELDQYLLQPRDVTAFLELIDNDKIISEFMKKDSCWKFIDKYTIAIIFTYFKRCKFTLIEYTRKNFFGCFYLAHDMEEDNEEWKYEIFPWVLGKNWDRHMKEFVKFKDTLLARLNYNTLVCLGSCMEILNSMRDHPVTKRERPAHHATTSEPQLKNNQQFVPRGPGRSPILCSACEEYGTMKRSEDSIFDSTCDDFFDNSLLNKQLSPFSDLSPSF